MCGWLGKGGEAKKERFKSSDRGNILTFYCENGHNLASCEASAWNRRRRDGVIQFVVGARDVVNKGAICIVLCDMVDGGMVGFDV